MNSASTHRPRSHSSSAVHYVTALLLALTAAGCASTPAAFSTKYPDNVGDDVDTLLERLKAAPPRRDSSIGVGVTSAPTRLYAYDLGARRVLWQTPAAPRFAPMLAGDTVITQEGALVVGRDVNTGAKRFDVDSGDMTLNGADGNDADVVIVLTSGMGTFAKSRVLLVRAGKVAWKRDVGATAGQPALVGSVVLVPWSNQFLSALTFDEGDELARIRIRDGVLGHAFTFGGNVYAGSQHGASQLVAAVAKGGMKAGPYLAAPSKDLPGQPTFLRDVYTPSAMPTPDGARNRIRVTWLPELKGDNSLSTTDNNLYLSFYRFVFALDPVTLDLHWLYSHERDLVGARAQVGGVVVADVDGEVRFLSARSGHSVWFEKNGPPSVCLELPSEHGAGTSASDTSAPDQTAVRQQLMAAARDSDARLVPMRLLAIDLLAKLDDAEATANLLGLCDDERTTTPVRKAACAALRERKTGTDVILTALARHTSYLDGTTAPPVGALAKAAAEQHEARAIPLLVSHLNDPATPPQTLGPIVTALGELGDKSAAVPLTTFLNLYHADPVDEHVTLALTFVPDVLVKLLGAEARAPLEPIATDALSTDTVRERARRAIAQIDEQAKAAEKDEAASKLAAEQAAAEPTKAADRVKKLMPEHVTEDLVKQALIPVRTQLQACVQNSGPDLFQARVVLVIEDAQVLMVSVSPENLQSCIEPLVRSQKFPATKVSKKERITYTVKRF